MLPALALLVVVVVQVAAVAKAISFTVDILEADLWSRFSFWTAKGWREEEEETNGGGVRKTKHSVRMGPTGDGLTHRLQRWPDTGRRSADTSRCSRRPAASCRAARSGEPHSKRRLWLDRLHSSRVVVKTAPTQIKTLPRLERIELQTKPKLERATKNNKTEKRDQYVFQFAAKWNSSISLQHFYLLIIVDS